MNTGKLAGPFVSTAAILLAGLACADDASFTPARFVDGELSLEKLVQFPDVEGDVSVAVYCAAQILGSGGIDRTHCFRSKSVDQAFIDAIEKAIKKSRATAASVDGKNYHVELYYRVVFIRKDGVPFIGVFANWGHDVDRYGIEYESPQRYSRLIYPTNCVEMSGEFDMFATMIVGTDGVVKGDVTFDRSEKNIKDGLCASSMERYHQRAKYIPGHHEGKPIEATFLEAWGEWDDMEVK